MKTHSPLNIRRVKPDTAQRKHIFSKKCRSSVSVLTEPHPKFGELITHFQIGSAGRFLPVNSAEQYGSFPLPAMEQSSFISERRFLEGSPTWEFLWLPLGLALPQGANVKANAVNLFALTNALTDAGYVHESEPQP